jgi:putative NADPH-quinone reductase
MKLLFVLCAPQRPSLGVSIAETIRDRLEASGQEVLWHDLYAEDFDPLLDPGELARGTSLDGLVQAHATALSEAQGLLILHPDWWGQTPAILKGWIDRVLREGVAYELEGEDGSEKTWKPLLGGKKALVIVTSDSEDPRREGLLREIWVEAVLGACGMEVEFIFLGKLRGAGAARRREMMDAAVERAAGLFALPGR